MKKLIILTGCSGHLGSAMLNELLNYYYVIGISRSAKDIEIKNKLKDRFIPYNCDFSLENTDKVILKIKTIIKDKDLTLKGLVNNAIFNMPSSPLSIEKEIASNSIEGLFSYHVRLSINLAPLFLSPASIINVSSMYGKVAPDPSIYVENSQMNSLLYGSFKAALIQSTKYLSGIFSESNIRVNSVSYGPFPSEKVINDNPEFIKKLIEKTHLKRIGKADESVGIIKFLLSDESSYITGADIPVDGGWTAW